MAATMMSIAIVPYILLLLLLTAVEFSARKNKKPKTGTNTRKARIAGPLSSESIVPSLPRKVRKSLVGFRNVRCLFSVAELEHLRIRINSLARAIAERLYKNCGHRLYSGHCKTKSTRNDDGPGFVCRKIRD